MALADILGSLGNFLPALAGPNGFAGPMAQLGGMEGGMDQAALSQAIGGLQQPLPQQQPRQMPKTPGKFMNTLGMIGDALATWRGGQPLYQMRLKEQQQNAALSNFLDDPEGSIRALMQFNAPLAIQLAQSRQKRVPEEAALLEYVGIDPRSDEGREVILGKLKGRGQADPNFIRELEALGIDPSSDEARELYYGRNSPAGYLLKPRGRSQGPAAATNGPPVGAVVGGYRFKGGNPNDRNSWEPASGGPTARPSGPFPASGN